MPAALSTFAGSGQTVSAYNSANNTFTISGNGSAAPFHMDDEPNDVTGRTLVFTNGAFPQFDFSGSFGDSTGLTRTTIIESSTAGQPGRTAYYAATNRFRGTEAVTPLQLWNVDWKIDSSDGSEGNSKESAFNIGGSPSSSDLNGRLIEFRGVNVEGAFADNTWHNQRARIINNPQRGFGLRLWMKLASNTLPFTVVVACAPAANPSGLVLLRGTTTPVASSLQYFANDLDANTTLTLSGLSAAGVGVFPSGGNVDNTTVALIDPVGNPGKLGTPFSGGSLVWGRLRTFRTQTINYSGATFTGSEHLVISNATASAPAWTNPANLTSNTNGVFAPVVAVKEVAHGTRNETTYPNYSIYTVGFNYRRKADTFTLSSTTAPLTDQNITVTPDTMADGSAITSFTASQSNRIDNLDKLKRAVKTHEVAHPSLSDGYAYILTNSAGEYVVMDEDDSTRGDVQFLTTSHSTYFNNTSDSTITVYNVPANATIGGGNANGLRLDDLTLSSGLVADFPYQNSTSTRRRISVTGAEHWTGAVHTSTGTNVGGLLAFSSGNLTRSFFTSTTGGIILTTARAGYVPGRVTATIASDAALSLDYTILGGVQETFASTGGEKYSSTLSGSTYGAATFDTSTFSDPKAYVEIADRQINAQTAYSIFHAGLLTLAGQKFLAANGATINVEDIASSGQFVFLNGDTLLRRAASGNSNAALTAEPIRADAMFVEDDRGDVPYIPGISLSGVDTKLDAIKTVVDAIQASGGGGGSGSNSLTGPWETLDTKTATGTYTLPNSKSFASFDNYMFLGATEGGSEISGFFTDAGWATGKTIRVDDVAAYFTATRINDTSWRIDALYNVSSLSVRGAEHAEASEAPSAATITTAVVAGIQAADFGGAAGTQTIAQQFDGIKTAVDSAKTDTTSIKSTVEGLNDLSASQVTSAVPSASQIATAVSGALTIPTAANIVTAIQAADFGTQSGTQTLANRIAAILTAIDDLNDLSAAQVTAAVPTVNQIAAAITIPTPPSVAQIATGVRAALNNLSASDVTGAVPTAAQVATAVMAKAVEEGLDVTKSIQLLLSVVAGDNTVNVNTDTATFKRLDAEKTDIYRATYDPATGMRSSGEVL